MSRKNIASVLAIFFGFIGVHKFYLNRFKTGVLYLLTSFTFIPLLLAIFIDLPAMRAIPNTLFNNIYSEEGYYMSNFEKKQFFKNILKNYLILIACFAIITFLSSYLSMYEYTIIY